MKKVGKKVIKSRRIVKSTNKKAPKVAEEVTVSVKDAKAASKKKASKKAAAKGSDGEEDEEMTHTEVNDLTEQADEEEE